MSNESVEWLNRNVLIGFTEKRGTAWHYRRSSQGAEPNHYVGGIPATDVERRLFFWEPEEWPLAALVEDEPEDLCPAEATRFSPVIETGSTRTVVEGHLPQRYRRGNRGGRSELHPPWLPGVAAGANLRPFRRGGYRLCGPS